MRVRGGARSGAATARMELCAAPLRKAEKLSAGERGQDGGGRWVNLGAGRLWNGGFSVLRIPCAQRLGWELKMEEYNCSADADQLSFSDGSTLFFFG